MRCSNLLPIFRLDCLSVLLLSFKSPLYILDNSPLSDTLFTYFFSQSVTLLILLRMSFAEEKFLIYQSPTYQFFPFMNCAFGVVSKKFSPNARSSRFSPMLSSKGFILRHFRYRPVIYFELIFVKNIRSVSRFIFYLFLIFYLACGSPFVPAPFVEKIYFFLHCVTLAPLSKISCDYIGVGLFLGSL